ncbi:MAG: DUF3617 family protein [Hyphomicrobium sp.]
MRSMLALSALFTLAVAFQPLPAYADDAAQTLPSRKAGIWELKTTMDEGNGPRDQTIKMCIDDAMEKSTVAASIAEHKESCESYKIKAAGGTTTVEADCQFNKRRVVSTTTMSGDFKTAFDIKIESRTTDPKEKSQTIVVNRTITQIGKYLGESCGELKPGEAEGPDGKKVMVQ